MTRRSRVFKLRLSSAGMDLLVVAHCHLIQSTRALIAWGTTLQVAVDLLDRMPAGTLTGHFDAEACAACLGTEVHHLGAPKGVNETAAGIAARIGDASTETGRPMISSVYIAALQALCAADAETLREVLKSVKAAR